MEVANSIYMTHNMNSAYKNDKKTKILNIHFALSNET